MGTLWVLGEHSVTGLSYHAGDTRGVVKDGGNLCKSTILYIAQATRRKR